MMELIIVSAVALAAVVALILCAVRASSSRKELLSAAQVAENANRKKIDSLIQENSALESRLSAKEEYMATLISSHESLLQNQKLAHEQALQAQKDNSERALKAQKESYDRAINSQKEAHEQALLAQKDNSERALKAQKESYDRAINSQKESYEQALLAQKDNSERALKAQKESYDRAINSQKESFEQAVSSQKEMQEKAMRMQKEQLEKGLESMSSVFKSLTAENSEYFRNQSADKIAELLKPINDKFAEFDRSVRESQKDSAAQSAALKIHIDDVLKQSRTVGDEARNLADALSGRAKTQGDFGEMILTDVLKNAGLTEGVHFVTQGVMSDESGREIRSESGGALIPDVIVYYPDDTAVIVDSKVSLSAYRRFFAAESVEERNRFAREHVESVRRHVDELKKKDYASYLPKEKRKVDYNIMFIPMEGAFRLLLEADPMMWQLAKDNNVLIVSQMTLLIVLNMINMAWKQASQERNIEEVYKTASELMSQLKGWMDSYVDIGNYLNRAATAYNDSTQKLSGSTQCVMKKIQKLEKLGLAPKKSAAKIKTGARLGAPSSIIPKELSGDTPDDSTLTDET